MKLYQPSRRPIIVHRPRTVDHHRRHALRAGVAALGAGLLACTGDESNAAAGGGGSGSTDCAEPDPTDGDRVVTIDEGENYSEVILKVGVARLSNNFGLMETNVAPRQLLVPHTHQHDDQIVYVIEGELEFEFGDGDHFLAPTGSYVIKPRYISHGFWNPSDTVEARYIEMSTRATFEPFVIATSSAETKKEIDELAAEAGIEFHYDQIPRLLMENMLTSIKGMDQPMPGVFEPNGVCPAG
ncbi:MAG: cupin domain-containing protein [Myxococcales bacterium]|nr:cupin domain-containing protein [Myxococcales bacterium]